MRIIFSTFLHNFLIIIAINGGTVLTAQYVYAKQIGKNMNTVQKSKAYLIEENDVLAISVFEEPDLSLSLKVAENGTISFPLIGETEVTGFTTYEMEQILEKRLKDGEFLINPSVSVKLDIALMKEYNDKEIFIIGAVKEPGPITVLGKYITVLEAVAMAGGFKKVAAPNRTTVTRTEDGKEKTMVVDLNKVKKGDTSSDILLKAGDIINVPETHF